MEQVFFQILNQPVDVAAMENAGVPPAVRDLVMRCTAKKPEDRPQSFQGDRRGTSRHPGGRFKVRHTAGSKIRAPARSVAGQPSSRQKSKTPDLDRHRGRGRDRGWNRFLAAAPAACDSAVPGMVYIPAGTFLAGEDKKPASLKAFFIDETEVSNAEFCKAMACSVEPGPGESSQGRHHGRRGPRVRQASRQAAADVARMGACTARDPGRVVPLGRSEGSLQGQCQRQSRGHARADAGAVFCRALLTT